MTKDLDLTFDFSDMANEEVKEEVKEEKKEDIVEEENPSITFAIDEEEIALPDDLQKEIIDDVKEDNSEYVGDEYIVEIPLNELKMGEEPQLEESERDITIESFELEEEGEPIISDEVQEFEEYLEEKTNNEEEPTISNEVEELDEYLEEKLENKEEPIISEEAKELDEYLEGKSTNEEQERDFTIDSLETDEEEITEPLNESTNEEEQTTQEENLEEELNEETNQIEEANNPQEELSDEWENLSMDLEEEPIIQSNSEEKIIPIEDTQKQEEIVVYEPEKIEENMGTQEIDTNPYIPKKILSPEEREEKINQEILDEFEDLEPQEEDKTEDFYEEPIEETRQEERVENENEVEESFEPINIETPVEIEEDIDVNLGQIEKVELWTQEPISKKLKFQFKKSYLIGIVAVIVLGIAWYFLKDILMPSQPTPQPSENQTNNENWTNDDNEGAEKDDGVDEEQEEAKNKLLLEQKEKMEKAFPFYKVVSLSNTTFSDYLWENFNNVVSEKFEKIIDPQVREATVFLYQYKPQKLSNKKLVSLLKKSVKWDKVAFKLIANIYWKLNKKVAWVEKKLKTDKWVKALNKLLIEQLNTNVPFVTSVNKELENIANKSNNRLALFVYKNRIKDLRQTIVETEPSIQEVLSDDDYVYFEKWLSLPETKNYNIKQEQKMTEILLWALLQNERIVSVLKKTPDKIAKELDNSTVLRDAIDLTYKIDFYHKYLSDMLKINLEEN